MNKEIILGHDELNKLNEENNGQNDIDNVKNCFSEDFNEILDSDIKIQEIAQSLSIMEEKGDYYGGYKIAKEAIDYGNNLKAFHKSFLYERLGDFTLQLGNYYKTLEYFNESKKYGNRLIYEKILNLYTSGLLIDEGGEFSYENNVDFLLGECKNACEYNMDAYAEYGYYTYLYKQDPEAAKKILEEGIKKGSFQAKQKYADIHKILFFSKFGEISNEKEKLDFIQNNKGEIEKIYKDFIEGGETKFLGELGIFYEEIGFYHNAILLFEEHIKKNNDYTYYMNLGDLYASNKTLLIPRESREKNIIDSYTALSKKALQKNDRENYIAGLRKIGEYFKTTKEAEKSIPYFNDIYSYAALHNDIELEEEAILSIINFYQKNDKMMLHLLSNLLEIDNRHLLLEAAFYESRDKIKALNSYLDAYGYGVFDSGLSLGMFLEEIAFTISNKENSVFFQDMANIAYSNGIFIKEDIKTIKELLK